MSSVQSVKDVRGWTPSGAAWSSPPHATCEPRPRAAALHHRRSVRFRAALLRRALASVGCAARLRPDVRRAEDGPSSLGPPKLRIFRGEKSGRSSDHSSRLVPLRPARVVHVGCDAKIGRIARRFDVEPFFPSLLRIEQPRLLLAIASAGRAKRGARGVPPPTWQDLSAERRHRGPEQHVAPEFACPTYRSGALSMRATAWSWAGVAMTSGTLSGSRVLRQRPFLKAHARSRRLLPRDENRG